MGYMEKQVFAALLVVLIAAIAVGLYVFCLYCLKDVEEEKAPVKREWKYRHPEGGDSVEKDN